MELWRWMSLMYVKEAFNREDINYYFHLLSKEIKKEFGRSIRLELIIVGGASILLNYNFRNSTTDVDAYISTGSSIKDAVCRVADKCNISRNWINSDFVKTSSYSDKLTEISKHYKTYNQVLEVRTVQSEYLIAMKIETLRVYKHDKSDILGILQACKNDGNKITIENILRAYEKLYNKELAGEKLEFLKTLFEGNIRYEEISYEESINKNLLIAFDGKYENVLREDNLEKVLEKLKNKKK